MQDKKRPNRVRRVAAAVVAVLAIAVLGYSGWVGYEASRQAVSVDEHRNRDCRTPGDLYGWTYEAINYPISDDARLRGQPGHERLRKPRREGRL